MTPGPLEALMAQATGVGQRAWARGVTAAAAVLLLGLPGRASGQGPGPNTGAVTLTGGVDVAGGYYFRGIPQEETGVVLQPHSAIGVALTRGNGVVARVGLWNSLHTGSAGLEGPTGRSWYQSIFSAMLDVGLGGGMRVSGGYSANTSPNGLFETISEVSIRVSLDDERGLAGVALAPHALLAIEIEGQADGGRQEGTYLELGISPSAELAGLALRAPVRLGLSLGEYYESVRVDERFGFMSIAGTVTRAIGPTPTRFGRWDVHGGVEFLKLGEHNRAFGETNVIGSVGMAFRY